MPTVRKFEQVLSKLADKEHFLFSLADLRGINPQQSKEAFKVMISRAVKKDLLRRICRGLYLYPRVSFESGMILYHSAARLTFIGGTCLRSCYSSQRLSEDLDFTGGHNFKRITLKDLSITLVNQLYKKYGLHVTISDPVKQTGNTCR